jgi:TRAP-type uncharacterized transport system substrate-binding protein
VGGSYHQDALKYQKILADQGIDLRIRPNPNSLEIVRNVANSQSGIDIGFVAQDVSSSQDAALFAVGQIELQPLFIFASADLGRRTVLDDLRGRRIVMPPADTATSAAAVRVLQLYDVTPENSQFAFMPLADAVKVLRAGLFDAGAFMLAPENTVIRTLTGDSGLHLVPIAEVKAIANHLPFMQAVVLPRGIYNIADAIPPNNIPMIAAPVGLVVRKGLHPYLLYSLLETMTKVHGGPSFISSAGDFPTMAGSQLAVDPLAALYYRSGVPWIYRELPPWPASIIEKYQLLFFVVFLFGAIYISIECLFDLARFAFESLPTRRPSLPDQPAE